MILFWNFGAIEIIYLQTYIPVPTYLPVLTFLLTLICIYYAIFSYFIIPKTELLGIVAAELATEIM